MILFQWQQEKEIEKPRRKKERNKKERKKERRKERKKERKKGINKEEKVEEKNKAHFYNQGLLRTFGLKGVSKENLKMKKN